MSSIASTSGWFNTVFAETIYNNKFSHTVEVNGSARKERWPDTAARLAHHVVRPYLPHLEAPIREAIEQKKLMPAGRYLYATGRRYHQVNNCALFDVEDSREGWGGLMNRATNTLMTGAGVGVVYNKIRPENQLVGGMGGKTTGPCALMRMLNEAGRYIMQGGSRRSALWAGLKWSHPDIMKFIGLKDWSPAVRRAKEEDFNFPAPMDGTNMSVILDDDFFAAYHDPHWSKTYRTWDTSYTVTHHDAHRVFWAVVAHALEHGEPAFSIDIGENAGEHLRNACTEVTSDRDNDVCNLLSINLARVRSPEEFEKMTELGTAFLLCGTLYSKLPVEAMYGVREEYRRIGLGLMGIHEWLLARGHRYGPNDELAGWMKIYKDRSRHHANYTADWLGIARPIKVRSIAPTGTISIVAETTSGGEPIFAVGIKRRYLHGEEWKYQYIVDNTAKALIDRGVDPELIEDAYTLAEDVERRVDFQVWMQKYVDQGISSTVNLPAWGSSLNNASRVRDFGNMLLSRLPGLRGITVYPDGSRGGQPLNRVSYAEAVRHLGNEYTEGGVTPDVAVEDTAHAHATDNPGAGCQGGFCAS